MKRNSLRGIVIVAAAALCVQLLAGCGGETGRTGSEVGEGAQESGEMRVSVLEGREPYDLFRQPWQDAQKTVSAPVSWNHTVYQENLIQDPQDMSSGAKCRAVEGKDYYILAVYTPQAEGERLYYLNRVEGDTLDTECFRLHLEELGDAQLFVNALDVSEGKPVLFVYKYDPEEQCLADYSAVWFDGEGHVESRQDLLQALQESGLVEPGEYLTAESAKWDSRGYYCVRGAARGEQYAVIDSQGKPVTVIDPTRGLDSAVVSLYHDGQGRCIWEAACAAERCNVFWGMREEQQVSLYRGDYQVVGNRLFNEYGDMYYINGRDELVRWDLSTGKSEILYEGGGGSFGDCYASAQDSEGNILLFYDNGRDYLFQIANDEVEQVQLTLATYGVADDFVRMFVGEYNRLHPNVKINIQSGTRDGAESEWSRIQADLIAGKGPDLLVADREHMETLQSKGILTELSQALSGETQEALFPGTLEYGTMDGGLYTMCYAASCESILVSRQVWEGESWTWEDVVTLLDEKEAAGEPYRSVTNVSESGLHLLMDFFLVDLEHSTLLDLEKGKAYFDTEAFCHLLEICRRYTGGDGNLNTDQEQARKRLKQGEILCYCPGLGGSGFLFFSQDMADLGEDYHFVGFPTEEECRGLFHGYNGVAVNAATQYPDLAAEAIEFIVSQNIQEMILTPVRGDTYTRRIREHINYQRADAKPIVFVKDGKYSTEVDAKPDGTSYLPEYLDFMSGCRPMSGRLEPIREIIEEEAKAFFDGDKDARTVADTIQSRVQVYLNENEG